MSFLLKQPKGGEKKKVSLILEPWRCVTVQMSRHHVQLSSLSGSKEHLELLGAATLPADVQTLNKGDRDLLEIDTKK